MGIEENKAAIRRFLSPEVFFGGEEHLAVVDEVFAPDVVFRGPENEAQVDGTEAIGRIKSELYGYQNLDGEIAILEQIAEGNRWPPAIRWRWRGPNLQASRLAVSLMARSRNT